jgi:hypothetical protein
MSRIAKWLKMLLNRYVYSNASRKAPIHSTTYLGGATTSSDIGEGGQAISQNGGGVEGRETKF